MDSFKDTVTWFLFFWYITIPLSVWIIYTVIVELLDLVLNNGKINEMLKHSDNLDIRPLMKDHEIQKRKQLKLNSSNLKEVKRQVEFSKLKTTQNRWKYSSFNLDNEKIITAKNLSDMFKID